MPSEEEVDALLRTFGMCLDPEPLPKDQRRCCFCNQQGDGQTDGPARLLNLDLDLWVSVLDCEEASPQPLGSGWSSRPQQRDGDLLSVSGPPQLCSVVK